MQQDPPLLRACDPSNGEHVYSIPSLSGFTPNTEAPTLPRPWSKLSRGDSEGSVHDPYDKVPKLTKRVATLPAVVLFFPLTPMQLLLARLEALTPEQLRKWARRTLIVPTTNLTITATEFQYYLMTIFHESWIAFMGHLLLMPLVILVTMRLIGPEIIASLLAIEWGVVAVWSGRKLWAALNVAFVIGLYLTLPRIDPYMPKDSLWALFWVSLLIAFSHVGEILLPPRATDIPEQWVAPEQLFAEKGYLVGIRGVLFSLVCGTVQEFIATFRVFPIFLLKAMRKLHYPDEIAEAVEEISHILAQSGAAALDLVALAPGHLEDTPAYPLLQRLKSLTPEERLQHFRKVVRESGIDEKISQEALVKLEASLGNEKIWARPAMRRRLIRMRALSLSQMGPHQPSRSELRPFRSNSRDASA